MILACLTSATLLAVPPRHRSSADSPIANYRRLSDKVHCGSEPTTAAQFRHLAKLGIRHIVSVDGKQPDKDEAANSGMSYVHIPFGYDDVPKEAAESITHVMRQLEGPVFFHCHHGRHRGPAAAAIACRVEGSATREESIRILEDSGTSEDYAGLWKAVREFKIPKAGRSLPELKSARPVQPLARSMAGIARHLEAFESQDDKRKQQAAILVYEGLKESHRLLPEDRPNEFREWMASSRDIARRLYQGAKANGESVAQDLQLLRKSCTNCHAAYRN